MIFFYCYYWVWAFTLFFEEVTEVHCSAAAAALIDGAAGFARVDFEELADDVVGVVVGFDGEEHVRSIAHIAGFGGAADDAEAGGLVFARFEIDAAFLVGGLDFAGSDFAAFLGAEFGAEVFAFPDDDGGGFGFAWCFGDGGGEVGGVRP